MGTAISALIVGGVIFGLGKIDIVPSFSAIERCSSFIVVCVANMRCVVLHSAH